MGIAHPTRYASYTLIRCNSKVENITKSEVLNLHGKCVVLKPMRTLAERAIVQALFSYMEKKGMRQTKLAEKLVWSQSDLNDTLRGRKGIGKNRQEYLEKRLGEPFRQELLLKIGELSESEKRKPGRVAERPTEYAIGKYILTDMEKDYVDKLLAILRGINQQAELAVKTNIDALCLYKKERRDIDDGYIRKLVEEKGKT